MASAGFEPANLGTKCQHATPRPPKPLKIVFVRQEKRMNKRNKEGKKTRKK
jgi:hypothetical protein